MALAGFSVVLLEKTTARQHKLCGEFMSPEVVEGFTEMDVLDPIQRAGSVSISRLRLTESSGSEFRIDLPAPALGLSRATLDEIMLDRSESAGVSVRRGVRVKGVDGNARDGFAVSTDTGPPIHARYVVGAFGKRSSLDGVLKRDHINQRSPWVGFKSHFHGLDVGDAIELHMFSRGYCGMSMVEGGALNACWIMHADDLKSAKGRPEEVVHRIFKSNAALADRFDAIEPIFDRYLSVGQLLFHPRGCFKDDVAFVGDAAGMISPLCGDGIAMAVESARIISPLLASVLDGERSFSTFKQDYQAAWTASFARRMKIGRTLQRVLMAKPAASLAVRLARFVPSLGTALIRATRGDVNVPRPVAAGPQ